MLSEAAIQSKSFIWAYNTYPQIRGLIFSVPNGGTRNAREAMLMRSTGLTPGVPDLLLLYHGVHAFEFKTPTGRLSPAQIKIHEIWQRNKINVYIVNDFEPFTEIITRIINES